MASQMLTHGYATRALGDGLVTSPMATGMWCWCRVWVMLVAGMTAVRIMCSVSMMRFAMGTLFWVLRRVWTVMDRSCSGTEAKRTLF